MNNKHAENQFQPTPLNDIDEPDEGEGEGEEEGGWVDLQAEKIFVAIPEKWMDDMGVNWVAIFWLILLIASVAGLVYSISESFVVQDVVRRGLADAKAVARLGKIALDSLVDGNLPTIPIAPNVPIITQRLPLILGGGIVLSLLGLLWAILARSRKYNNRRSQRADLQKAGLQKTIVRLRNELLKLVAEIKSATVELDQVADGTETFVAELTERLEMDVRQAPEIAQPAQPSLCLAENAQQINALVETMCEIAEQTRVAALNISIQVATVKGRGFIAIGEEMQRLAEQSGWVANEINERIKNDQQDANLAITFIESEPMASENESADQDSSDMINQDEVALILAQIKSVTQKLRHAIDKFNVLAE